MLVLSRKAMESVFISDAIVITVLSVVGNRVKLGIDAPASISIRRSELGELIAVPRVSGATDAHSVVMCSR